ncbi:MAG: radical SAM protein [Thermoplasmata archaeon]
MEELRGVYVPAPRDSFTIREVHVDHALRKDPLPWLDYSFNPYVGCYHGCVFCYSPRLLRLDRDEWGQSVVVKRNAATALARDVRTFPRGDVLISTATDPYQYLEGKYRITRHALEVLLRVQWPVSVLTRSPLVTRDLDLFHRFQEVEVGLSVPTLDDRARALLEPWAPPIPARLRCLQQLADAGVATFVGFAPAYPLTDGWTPRKIAETFSALGVRKAFSRTLDARWGVREAMRVQLEDTPLAWSLQRMGDRPYMRALISEVAEECEARGVSFRRERPRRVKGSTRRENQPDLAALYAEGAARRKSRGRSPASGG